MRTPEFPRGRRIILVGNDATYQMGTFGVQEDLFFQRVSEVARKQVKDGKSVEFDCCTKLGLIKDGEGGSCCRLVVT